jgi:4-hydroxy-tetrahydrodipicolinate synthase
VPSAAYKPTRVFVALVTPFDRNDAVDHGALERLAADALDAGAQGIVALATTGEPTALDAAERDAVVATIAAVCADKGRELIVGASTNDTRETIRRHEALADVEGVTASLAVVPYYVRPSEAAIVEHFRVVAERSPVPVVIYNIPYRTGRGLGADALLEVAAIENIAGVKQAVNGIDADTLRVLAEAPDSFAMLGGDDAYLFPMALMGAKGTICASANVATARFVAMIDDGLAGRVDDGRAHHEALLPLVLALFAEPSPAVIKAALHAQGRIPTPDVRMPLANASAAAAERAAAALGALDG